MKKINESVAFGVVSVVEMKDLIDSERNEDKKETLKCVRFSFYYLMDNLINQFGVSSEDIKNALVENGYEYRMACEFVDAYNDWASHVIKVNERGDNT
ncbi:MAG: hypothetical protein WC365_01230 [Candidatus Babeliales bacterium]|jgi:hypothetical protein